MITFDGEGGYVSLIIFLKLKKHGDLETKLKNHGNLENLLILS